MDRRGVTLIEIMIAMVILTVVLLGMGRFLVGFSRSTMQADARTLAVTLASQRLSEVRAAPNYGGLETIYVGTETAIPGFTGYVRRTTITHTGGPRPTFTNDFKTITVEVVAPGLPQPVRKTIVVAAP